ncbi:MAG: exodeoxyribonuclease VII large subunit [Erythrobacter sp.]|nr:exodeoxyribonuclease VII large subunit [Erythrobacter sp.]
MAASFPPDDNNEGLVARSRAGDNAEPLSVSEISNILKRTVEDRFGFVRLRGELSGVKRAASGHLYASLKDEKAVIDAVMWRGNAQRLPFQPEDGLEVVASGKLTTYPGRSKYQIVVERMELAGEGALLALLEKTKARLQAEGLFDDARKRRLPFLPKTIGVVTSPTGAVIRDILHRLADRFPSRVIVWPVLVQGQGAAEQVAGAVRGFSGLPDGHPDRPDLVIVARGGGSIEDLWNFNEEVVVRAVAECSIPTISAVGHETDTTLVDFAADMRAPTPTAAAEIAVPVRAELAATLDDFAARTKRAILRPVQLGRERLQARAERLPTPETLLQPQGQQLDDLSERLRRGLQDRTAQGRERLGNLRLSPAVLSRSLRDATRSLEAFRLTPSLVTKPLADRREKLAAIARLAEQLHPDRPLERGYVRVTGADGRTLTDKVQAEKEAALTLKFRDGELDVSTGEAPPPRPTPAPRRNPPKKGTPPAQDDLFG